MAKEDEERITFITSQGIFCYSKMPFGLKNPEATYQRLVDKAFQKQIGRNLEVNRGRHVPGLQGKHQGDKVHKDFLWTVEAEAAFKQIKQLIAELQPLNAPMEKEELIVYLAVAQEAVKDDSSDTPMEAEEELSNPWTLFMHGSSCVDGFGASLILTDLEGAKFTYALRFRFDATNNEAEYEALIAGLKIAKQMGVKNLQVSVDSCLVANQVPRSENKKADALRKMASTSFVHLTKQVLVEEPKEKSINIAKVLAVVEEEGDT
ncbi:reverse transcriptase domain-containing protein [Tanacetum coccineum]